MKRREDFQRQKEVLGLEKKRPAGKNPRKVGDAGQEKAEVQDLCFSLE